MTKEEIQKAYYYIAKVDTNAPKDKQCPAYYTHSGWMQCAEWMEAWMIHKAYEWLKRNTPIGLMEEEIPDFLEDFKKAMEE